MNTQLWSFNILSLIVCLILVKCQEEDALVILLLLCDLSLSQIIERAVCVWTHQTLRRFNIGQHVRNEGAGSLLLNLFVSRARIWLENRLRLDLDLHFSL